MNVKLAAHLLSESVVKSLQFCKEENLPGFEGCEATMRFIRIFDKLFDILSSRTLRSWRLKKPMQAPNEAEIFDFLCQAKAYLFSLKESREGKNMLDSNRKTGFLGFAICIDSLLSLYRFLISSNRFGMTFLCMFKLSQDHIELFFGKIRSLGGCNNNPPRGIIMLVKHLLPPCTKRIGKQADRLWHSWCYLPDSDFVCFCKSDQLWSFSILFTGQTLKTVQNITLLRLTLAGPI